MKYLATAFLSLVLGASPALADITEGSVGTSAAARVASPPALAARAAKPRFARPLDANALREAARARQSAGRNDFSTTTRAADGTVRRTEAGPATRAVMGDRRTDAAPELESAPAGFEAGERAVIGKDTRIRIEDSTPYPFSAIGMVFAWFEDEDGEEEAYGCSASLVGPRTVVTSGRCLYDHDREEPWFTDLVFYPGVNGEDVLPFGSYEYENAHVPTAFIENFDGGYASVWENDIGLVELVAPIGDDLGWLQTRRSTNIGQFDANLVGYHNDKPHGTMWRSKCTVREVDIYELDILHACDTGGDETWGAPVYIYYGTDKPRRLVAVNLGTDNAGTNFALLLTAQLAAWIKDYAQ